MTLSYLGMDNSPKLSCTLNPHLHLRNTVLTLPDKICLDIPQTPLTSALPLSPPYGELWLLGPEGTLAELKTQTDLPASGVLGLKVYATTPCVFFFFFFLVLKPCRVQTGPQAQ